MIDLDHSGRPPGRAARAHHWSHDVIGARWLLVGAILLASLFFFVNRRYYIDDALITLRYCRNLLEGNGLVWNVGERVEGYSNFLYLMVVAGFGALGVDLVSATRIVGIGAYVGIVTVVYWYTADARRKGAASRAALPVISVLVSCPLIVWSIGGLEGTLCALLAVSGVALIARHLFTNERGGLAWAGALLALATMTRMDGSLFLIASVLYLLVSNGVRGGAPAVAVLVGAFLVVYCPYFAWRCWYYGDLLPNTAYAKGTSIDVHTLLHGARFVLGILLRPPFIGVWIAVSAVAAWRGRTFSPRLAYFVTVSVVYMAFPVLAGGDYMPAGRFMVPAIPILALALHEALGTADFAHSAGRAQVLGASLLACAALQAPDSTLNPALTESTAFLGIIVGDYAERHWPRGSVVAVDPAGALPYAARSLRFIDMLGLNDRHIARAPTRHFDLPRAAMPGHRKGDGSYVLGRRPDFIILGPPEGTRLADPWWVSDYEIGLRRAEFEQLYRLEEVDIDARPYRGHLAYPASAKGKIRFVYYRLRQAPQGAPCW
jgi:hypothetical protein